MIEQPDAELDITRDDEGRITHFAFKIHDEGDKRQKAYEFLSMVRCMFEAEGPEDHTTTVDVHVGF